MNIKQKVIVITGGGSGMGAATAAHLAEQGAKVALLDINLEKAESVANSIDGMAVQCDVFSSESVTAAIDQIYQQLAAIHVVINCAGIAPAARIVGKDGPMPLADFEQVIHVNLLGTFNVMRLAAAKMIHQDPIDDHGQRGVIINTASVAAFDGQLGQAAYSASKGGVVAMTLPAARELSQFGVRVMTIAPGIVDTPMMAAMPDKVQASLQSQITFPKRFAQPQEYASLAQHIIENDYLNAEVIRLDGGIRMSAK